ncbi:MAG: M1 family metallopeptidase, partial [Candidatus Thermoplasmatota archaeon]|nr:M1 family metallopeptidase [Candidatus Thermoplasmatota archaeon]
AEIIAHEITHQWFGDLVTMKWWNDLWLNESFATFMGVKATDHYFPEWNPFEYYFELRQGPALLGDSLQSSHPIDVDVTDPDTISQIFDEISYGKGSSILRMFEAYVGADNFRNGIRSYLAKHKYGNAEGRDLWEEVEKASGLEVGRIMSAWIKREGYPVVTVRREGNSLKLIQERFLLGGKSEEMPWPIPVEIRVGDESKYHLFEGRETSIEANGDFVINPERKGFYRIFYDEPMEITLSRVRGMSEFEQWGIVSDFYAFLQSGRVNLKTYLSVVNATQGSQYKMPYLIAADQLFHLSVLYPDISEIRDFAVSYLKTALPNIKKLAETDGKYRDLEGKIMSRLATLDMEFARTIAVEFERFESVNPDLRLSIALAYARSEKNMERMMQVLESLDNDEDRTKIISALGWIDMPDAMDNVAKHIEEGKIKKQDIATYYYVQAIANPYNRDELFKRIPGIVSRVSEIFVGGIQGSRLVELSISTLGATRRNDALKLSDSLKNPKVSMGLAKGLELLEINARTYEQIKAAN